MPCTSHPLTPLACAPLRAPADHILLSSLRQISDVILVHNEDALLDPTADDTVGFYAMVTAAGGWVGWLGG